MILVNGAPADAIAATDRGLAYGDGVFRTMVARDGRARWWPEHFQKLQQDCRALAIPCPGEDILTGEVARVAAGGDAQVVKIVVTRGPAERGYAPPPEPKPTRIVLGAPMPAYPDHHRTEGIRVHLCRTRLAAQPRLAGVKHLNRLENVLARGEWIDPAIPEGLMLDEGGNVIGGTMTNVFILEGDRLITPDLTHCGVAGVARGRVIQAAGQAGIPCAIEPVALARLLAADEVFVVNSVIGAWQVRHCAGKEWPGGRYIARVREWLDA